MEYGVEPMITSHQPYRALKPEDTVMMVPEVATVRDHILWSFFSFVFFNVCCIGFMALAFSVKSRDRKVIGDAEGARHYASTAKGLNIAATTISLVILVISIVVICTGVQF